MQLGSNTVTAGAETSARMPNSDVLLARHAPAKPELQGNKRPRSEAAQEDGFVRSAYLVLVSRLEDMVRNGARDEGSLAELRVLVGKRMAMLTESARQKVQALGEFQATGASTTQHLPNLLDALLRDRNTAETGFALLKHPLFVSYMKDDRQVVTYGPQGLLRAS